MSPKITARWSLKVSEWHPSQEEHDHALNCIQPEERTRIQKIKIYEDAKLALAGRLLLRGVFHKLYNVSWLDLKFGRTNEGKPVLLSPDTQPKSTDYSKIVFNISHHGDWVVLVAAETFDPDGSIGVDLTKVEEPHSGTVGEYFAIMKEIFTEYEWSIIRAPPNQQIQLHRFYRYWCLKESYVKAIGIGLAQNLRALEFHLSGDADVIRDTKIVKLGTQLFVNNRLLEEWKFEECYLDDEHCVAISYNCGSNVTRVESNNCFFEHVDIDEILLHALTLA